MLSFRKISLTLISVLLVACQTTVAKAPAARKAAQVDDLPADAIIIQNPYFKTVYSTQKHIAYYSEYTLTADHLSMPQVGRSDKFHRDPQLRAQRLLAVPPSWYMKSGYDRGHLAPSADFNWDTDANYATFTMSNMTPQRPKLNRKAWEALESEVRFWTCTEKSVEVMSGPVLEDGLAPLNGHPMPVPNRFFKIVVQTNPPQKAIAFIMSQDDHLRTDYKSRVATIADVEKATGLKLFEDELTDDNPVRTHSDLSEWHEGNCVKEFAP